VVVVTAAGCYGAAPPRPARVQLPALVPGLEIDVRSETSTELENVSKKSWTCPQGEVEGSPKCSYTTYSVREPVTRTITHATYGDLELTDEQLHVMADDEHEAKRVRLDELRAQCAAANGPRRVGIALALGGLALWGIAAATQQAVFTYAGAAAFTGSIGAYGYGFFARGGNMCGDANDLVDDLTSGSRRFVYTYDRDAEIREVAERFNARSRTLARQQP
jgi:hypothetical protein